jgi:drug/metabolite transporter (DMT)-like permease
MLDHGGSIDSWNVGDLWSIGAAAASAMFILRLEAASEAVPNNASGLNAACLWVVTFLSFLWTFFNSSSGNNSHAWDGASSSSTDAFMSWMSTSCSTMTSDLGHVILAHPVELIYLGGVTTALANYIQTIAQRSLTAERASIIYSMDPVYGAIFAYLLLGETLGMYGIYGASIIGVAAATNAFLDLGAKTNEGNDDNDNENLKMMDSVTDPSIRNESIS